MDFTFKAFTHSFRKAIQGYFPEGDAPPFPLGHAREMLSAAFGYSTHAAMTAAVAEGIEPDDFVGARHIVLDMDSVARRLADLGYADWADGVFEPLLDAFSPYAPVLCVHSSMSSLHRFVDDCQPMHSRAVAGVYRERCPIEQVEPGAAVWTFASGDSGSCKCFELIGRRVLGCFGAVSPSPARLDHFWSVVERSRLAAGRDVEVRPAFLEQELDRLHTAEVIEFDRVFHSLMARAYCPILWSAARFLEGGYVSDDAFTDFRSWLISEGRARFEAVLKDPNALGCASAQHQNSFLHEGFCYAAWAVVVERRGHDLEGYSAHDFVELPFGVDEVDPEVFFPKLAPLVKERRATGLYSDTFEMDPAASVPPTL